MFARTVNVPIQKSFTSLGLVFAVLVSFAGRSGTAGDLSAQSALAASATPTLFGCPMFPGNNIWNVPVDNLPADSHSNAWVSSIGLATGLHMDFGSGTWDGGPIGIPYNAGDSATPRYDVDFYYGTESDPGAYPIPTNPLIEYGSDHHLLVLDQSSCRLYEMYDVSQNADGSWSGGSGAIWDLNSNALRAADWTSADAAGLPILPGLVRWGEVAAGEIDHAIRFTTHATNSYIWPARHLTSGTPGVLTSTPPMGARFRLKASFDISGYPAQLQVILRAMKKYGLILADNGSDWYITGAPDPHWDNDMLHLLDNVTGTNFEAVNVSGLMVSSNSGATNLGVAISGSSGVGGATLSYSTDSMHTTTSNANGGYGITVPYNWTGSVTPSRTYYTFSPPSKTYTNATADQVDQNYTATLHTFADIPVATKEWMEPWIDAFYAHGITTGCGTNPLVYCPENNVTRAEMAVFLLRAKHGGSYQPPAASHFFYDVPVATKGWMEPWIDEFYREGMTTGCGQDPLVFCPENQVTRAEMAVFVLRSTHATGWQPPTATGIFGDVPVLNQEWMQPWIEEFYHEGITSGCGTAPLRYCPENQTTRAEMAVFIGRAYGLYP